MGYQGDVFSQTNHQQLETNNFCCINLFIRVFAPKNTENPNYHLELINYITCWGNDLNKNSQVILDMVPRRSRRNKSKKQKSSKNIKTIYVISLLAVFIAIIGGYFLFGGNQVSMQNKVLFNTNMGDIVIELREDMPTTTDNFRKLVNEGVYDGTVFHRVIENFMIQGGDPTGTGYGDPSIPNIKDEFTASNHNDKGAIAMANAGPNTGSSQFFINVVNNNHLDTQHPVFGKVIEGMDVVDSISKVDTNANNRPTKDVIIINAEIFE